MKITPTQKLLIKEIKRIYGATDEEILNNGISSYQILTEN